METVWLKIGNTYHQTFKTSQEILENLEPRVYTLVQNPDSGEIYLEDYADKFNFGFKVYGLETEFLNYVVETYKHTTQNLGILLDGKKGTGKSMCAKILCNMLNLPVIIVSRPFNGLQEFMAKFMNECVFFFDEFEKTFGNNKRDDDGVTSMLLSVMDGVYNTAKRQVFILTTNNTYIDDNFLGRPSRIRYHKTFGNLKLETVLEIIKDLLEDKTRTNDVVDLVNSLSLSTIDTLKTIIMDINIHPNTPISLIREYLNLEFAKHRYRIRAKRLRSNDPKYDTYSFADLMEEVSHEGEKVLSEDGKEEYEVDLEDYYEIYERNESTDRMVAYMQEGDYFWSGEVVRPLDENNCLIIERSNYDERWFIQILNPDSTPKLYRHLEAW